MFASFALAIFLILLTALYMKSRRPSYYPPGPPTVPFIGNLNLDMTNMLRTFRECRARYGDIFSLILGKETVVVVCGREKLQKVFVENGDISSHRPCSFLNSELLTTHGITGSNGLVWKKIRSALLFAFRNQGSEKLPQEENILKEVKVLHRKVEEMQGQPFDITQLVYVSVSNIVCCFSFGKRYDHDNENLQTLTSIVSRISSNPDVVGLLTFLPFVKYLPFDLFGAQKLKKSFMKLKEFCENEMIRHKKTYQDGIIRDLIDDLIKIQAEGERQGFQITDEMITEVIIEIFAAGSDTTSATLRWFLLFMIKYQNVQKRMRQEILDNIGTAMPVSLQDRKKLKYCQAVILETLRLGTVTPFSLPHMASEDIHLVDYIIPKGAYILPSLDSIHRNEEEFENPNEFNPERFLDGDGNLIKTKTILPFSVGRRICPGESLANKELFLFSTNIVQSFQLFPGKKEDTEPGFSFGIIYAPKPFQLMAVKLRT